MSCEASTNTAGIYDGIRALVMERVEGATLARIAGVEVLSELLRDR